MQVIVVDDHPLILEALQQVLLRLDRTAEVLTASRCRAALELAVRYREVELVLLDFNLPDLTGIPALRTWRQQFPALPIVIISADQDRHTVTAAMAAGAAGFIPKSYSNELMLSALRLVLAGGRFVPPEIISAPRKHVGLEASSTDSAFSSRASLGLSQRQLEVLSLMAQGKPNKVIARDLELSERTVKAHLTEVFRALKVVNRTQATLAAARFGLLAGAATGITLSNSTHQRRGTKKPV